MARKTPSWRGGAGIVAWLYGHYKYGVIPWLDHGIQKNLNKRLDAVIKSRHDTERFVKIQAMNNAGTKRCLAMTIPALLPGSTIAEKRNLVNLTFSNLSLNGEKLDFMLRPPFNAFVEIPKTKEWWV